MVLRNRRLYSTSYSILFWIPLYCLEDIYIFLGMDRLYQRSNSGNQKYHKCYKKHCMVDRILRLNHHRNHQDNYTTVHFIYPLYITDNSDCYQRKRGTYDCNQDNYIVPRLRRFQKDSYNFLQLICSLDNSCIGLNQIHKNHIRKHRESTFLIFHYRRSLRGTSNQFQLDRLYNLCTCLH